MRTANSGNGNGKGQSETAPSLIRLTDGLSVRLEASNSRRNGHLRPPLNVHFVPRETQFEALPDGSVIDLVRENSGELSFALCGNRGSTVKRTFQNGDLTFIPPRMHQSFVDALRWPASLGSSETPGTLL